MLPVQVRRLCRGDEKLAAIRVGTRVRHRQKAWLSVLLLKIFVSELRTVDGFAASAISTSEVTTLTHEARDDAMELAPLVVQFLATLAHALLSRAKRAEVLCTFRCDVLPEEEAKTKELK